MHRVRVIYFFTFTGWKKDNDDGWKEKKWEERPPREDKGKGKGKEGGKRLPKQRHELEDSDLTAEDKQLMMEFYPSATATSVGVTIKVNAAKEKELLKIKKKLRDIENLEKKAEEGRKLDGHNSPD